MAITIRTQDIGDEFDDLFTKFNNNTINYLEKFSFVNNGLLEEDFKEELEFSLDTFLIGNKMSIAYLADVDLSGTSPILNDNHFLVYDSTSETFRHKQPTDVITSLGITATASELNYLDITTLGTSEASKAITVNASGDLIIPDSDKFQFGAGLDMTLYHDGTDSYITNSTGTLKLATETSGIAVQIGHTTSEVTIGDNLTVTGNLTVNGTTTTVNSTVTTLDDPIITLGGDTASASDDNKDRGVEFKWHNGSSAKVGFFGYDDSSSKFTFIPDATNSSEVFSGSAGDVAFGAGDFSGDLVVDTSVLKVDSSNNRVGIGTASPSKTFHVVDTTSDAEVARFQGADGHVSIVNGSKITFSRNAINYLTCTDSSGALRFETGGSGNNRLTIDNSGTSSFTGDIVLDNAKSLKLSELDSNGSHTISIKAPDSVTADVTLVLPDGAGSNGQALTTNGSGVLSWSTVSGSGGLTSSDITGQTAKTTVNNNDLVILADSQDSNNLKKMTRANFVAGLTANKTYSSQTSNFTAAVNYHYSVNTTSGAVNVSLPQLSTTTSGESITIKFRAGTNFLTMVPYSGNTIEGLNNLILTDSAAPGQSITLVSNGSSAWEII